MKKFSIIFVLFIFMILSACGTVITYPNIEYNNSNINADILNRTFLLDEGYSLDVSNPYDKIDTANGYDITFHFVKVEN